MTSRDSASGQAGPNCLYLDAADKRAMPPHTARWLVRQKLKDNLYQQTLRDYSLTNPAFHDHQERLLESDLHRLVRLHWEVVTALARAR